MNERVLVLGLCLWLGYIAAQGQAEAAVYYVDPSGSDSNPGTEAQPWRTLQKAAASVQPGDTVLVNSGTYQGFYTVKGGTAASPVVFKANGANVVISGGNPKTPDNINVENTDYVVIEGFIVRDAKRAGIRVAESRGVVVKNNMVGPNGKWGIFTGFAPHVQIINNKAFGSSREHGIYVSNSRVVDDAPVIRGNECYKNHMNGIQVNGDCRAGGDGIIAGAVIENNIVHDNGFKGLSLISMQNSLVQNNLIYHNGIRGGAGGIHLTDELGCGRPSNGNTVVNNTVIEPRMAGIRITDGARRNVVFNNLVVSAKPIVDEVGGNDIDAASNVRLNAAPNLFVDAEAGDYRLVPACPARNLGRASYRGKKAPTHDLAGKKRPEETAISVGAFE